LLTWRARPEEFLELEEVETALARKSKDELIALVTQMLRQHPELELLLATPLPLPTGNSGQAPVDPAAFRRQAAAAFRRGGYDWGAEASIAADLEAIVAIGDGFAAQGDYAGAATVYSAVATEIMESYEQVHDEGEIGNVVAACVAGLGRCLAGERADAAAREVILRALFAIYGFDVQLGGVGLADEAPELIVHHATPEERAMVVGWVRAVLPAGGDWTASFRRQAYGGLLLELEGDTLDDEAYVRICRETGRTADLVDRLLALGRLDEALEEMGRAADADAPHLADLVVEHGHGVEAERLMAERAATTADPRITIWLKDRYKGRGATAAALEMAEKLFREQPSFERYAEMRELGRALGRWEAGRPRVLAFLSKREQSHLLIRIFLDEGEIDQALTALKTARLGWSHAYGGANLALEVAQAATATRPRAALELYRQEAERSISLQGRDNYRAACRLLAKVRALYDGLGEAWAWTGYINGLRETHRRLRAFQEELIAAKL
jgi:tetratricopeptide (TPR) repeat protein